MSMYVRVYDCFKSRQNEKENSVSSKQRFEEAAAVSQQVALEKGRRKYPIIQKKPSPSLQRDENSTEREKRENSRADFPF